MLRESFLQFLSNKLFCLNPYKARVAALTAEKYTTFGIVNLYKLYGPH